MSATYVRLVVNSTNNIEISHFVKVKKFNKYIKRIFGLLVIVLLSCNSEKPPLKTNGYIEPLIEMVCKTEGIVRTSDNKGNFHAEAEKINKNYIIVRLALNQLTPKEYLEKRVYSNFTTYIYDKYSDTSPFFVPDSKTWTFILQVDGDKLVSIRQIVNYETIYPDKNSNDDFGF